MGNLGLGEPPLRSDDNPLRHPLSTDLTPDHVCDRSCHCRVAAPDEERRMRRGEDVVSTLILAMESATRVERERIVTCITAYAERQSADTGHGRAIRAAMRHLLQQIEAQR